MHFQRFVINFKNCVPTQLVIYSSINFATTCLCFDFLNQFIPSPNQHKFFPVFHIYRLQIVTHINQPSYPWSSRPSTSFCFHSYISFTIVEESIICMWPNCLIIRAVIILTMSNPLIRGSSSALFRILQIYSPVRSGPDIVLTIFLSTKRILFLTPSLTEKLTN